jgi:hypothetical protein
MGTFVAFFGGRLVLRYKEANNPKFYCNAPSVSAPLRDMAEQIRLKKAPGRPKFSCAARGLDTA